MVFEKSFREVGGMKSLAAQPKVTSAKGVPRGFVEKVAK